MAKIFYAFSEEEYAQVQGMSKMIEQLVKENAELRKYEDINHPLRVELRSLEFRYKALAERATNSQCEIQDLKAGLNSCNKLLADKTHELLVKEAELASLSSKLREMERDMKDTEDALKLARIKIACLESGGL